MPAVPTYDDLAARLEKVSGGDERKLNRLMLACVEQSGLPLPPVAAEASRVARRYWEDETATDADLAAAGTRCVAGADPCRYPGEGNADYEMTRLTLSVTTPPEPDLYHSEEEVGDCIGWFPQQLGAAARAVGDDRVLGRALFAVPFLAESWDVDAAAA